VNWIRRWPRNTMLIMAVILSPLHGFSLVIIVPAARAGGHERLKSFGFLGGSQPRKRRRTGCRRLLFPQPCGAGRKQHDELSPRCAPARSHSASGRGHPAAVPGNAPPGRKSLEKRLERSDTGLSTLVFLSPARPGATARTHSLLVQDLCRPSRKNANAMPWALDGQSANSSRVRQRPSSSCAMPSRSWSGAPAAVAFDDLVSHADRGGQSAGSGPKVAAQSPGAARRQ